MRQEVIVMGFDSSQLPTALLLLPALSGTLQLLPRMQAWHLVLSLASRETAAGCAWHRARESHLVKLPARHPGAHIILAIPDNNTDSLCCDWQHPHHSDTLSPASPQQRQDHCFLYGTLDPALRGLRDASGGHIDGL